MGAFLIYMIEVAVIMSVLYLGYKWMLASATFHSFNRIILGGIYAASFLIPFAVPFLSFTTQTAAVEIGMPVAVAVAERIPDSMETVSQVEIPWRTIVYSIYIIGFAVALTVTAISAVKVARIFRVSTPLPGHPDARLSTMASSPFSWAGLIVVTDSDLDENLDIVLAHEREHLRRRHWIDLALAQVVTLFQWFSPAAWLMMRELKAVHEFEVDDEISASDPYAYQMMLIKKTAGSSFPTFADSLNSQLKLRITMMLSKKSKGSRRIAAAALLPMAALAALALSQPAVADVFSVINPTVSDREVNDFSSPLQIEETKAADEDRAITSDVSTNDTQKSVPSATETEDTVAEMNEGIPEPQKKSDVKVQTSKKTVYLLDGKPFKGDLSKIDPEAIAAMNVRGATDEYPNGYIEIFTKEYAKTHEIPQVKSQTRDSNKGKEIYVAVEKQAEYPGGLPELMKFLADHVKYPEGPYENARVIVKFVINKDGHVSDPVIVKSGGERFDAESLRVVGLMPKWIPAENNGQPVDSYFTIPIMFRAKDDATKENPAK